MKENPWQRLSRIVYARIDELGITQNDIENRGGPSSAWVRKIKTYEGRPSNRSTKSLRGLSVALEWPADTARNMLVSDYGGAKGKSLEAFLEDEEDRLIHWEQPSDDPAVMVRQFTDLLNTDAIKGLSDAEWADLAEAIQSKLPKPASGSGKRPQRKTGT